MDDHTKWWNCSIDAQRMSQLVAHMLRYLLDHFHTGPYKHGEQDTMVMTTKCLELLCKYKPECMVKSIFCLQQSTTE